MAEYRSDGHVTAVPACWLEQCRPVMPIPCRKQRVIAHTHDHAGFIELGQCCLRAVALARRHCLDMPALLRVECLLELRETGPHQCIEQVMPVVGAGGDAPLRDTHLVVQTVGQQRGILFNQAFAGQFQPRIKRSDGRPCSAVQQITEVMQPAKQRMPECLRIDRRTRRRHEAPGTAVATGGGGRARRSR
ncbi:hypothetical protein G6F65_019213 [Rhizopus arrhizus]|nr:hypothetical protein G6F65_019213 [Rhizopus arrhizus]